MRARVVDTGYSYTTYRGWAIRHDLRHYKRYVVPNIGNVFDIVAEGPHGDQNYYLYGIEDELGNQFIIEKDGIEILDIDNNGNFLLGL